LNGLLDFEKRDKDIWEILRATSNTISSDSVRYWIKDNTEVREELFMQLFTFLKIKVLY